MNRILLREAAVEQLYLNLLGNCDYPDVRAFAEELLKERQRQVRDLERSLIRMYASFDPAGC
jgi:hypothetical protein